MIILSEILMQHHELKSYADLTQVIIKKAKQGEILFDIDIKPPFTDTPSAWESDLENIFTSGFLH